MAPRMSLQFTDLHSSSSSEQSSHGSSSDESQPLPRQLRNGRISSNSTSSVYSSSSSQNSLNDSSSDKNQPSNRHPRNPSKIEIFVGKKKVKISIKILKEIKKLQISTKKIIPKLSFAKLVQEVMQQRGQYHIQKNALEGLQEAVEMFITQVFEDTNRCAVHANRVTIKPNDLQLVANLASRHDPVFASMCNI